jgi:predicted nucleotide-binding protein (sugar kinase/HSP70/actin superfamily)
MARFSCPTCAATYAVLRAAKVPKPVAKGVAYSRPTKRLDRGLKRTEMVRKTSAATKKLSKHLKEANKKARKKNGSFKKGWSQSRVMKEAHRLCGHKKKRR